MEGEGVLLSLDNSSTGVGTSCIRTCSCLMDMVSDLSLSPSPSSLSPPPSLPLPSLLLPPCLTSKALSITPALSPHTYKQALTDRVYIFSYTEQRTTPQGQVYFIHRATGMSTWHDPRFRDISIDTEELGNLGEGWEIRYTAHGRRYFVDHINRTTQFTGE